MLVTLFLDARIPSRMKHLMRDPLLVPDLDVKAVVVGSSKKFNFLRVAMTLQYLLNPDVDFIGANVDRT